MNKDLCLINCNNQKHNILYHINSAKIAKVDKSIHLEQFSEMDLSNLVKDLPSEAAKDTELVPGKGCIGLTFMSSRTCNLGCKYCFAGEGEYGNVIQKPTFFTYEKYMKAIKMGCKMYPEGIKSISFFGGEPLLNYKELKKFIPDCIDYFLNRNLPVPAMSVCTNLVLLTDEMAKFFKKYGVYIVISLDGPKEINDIARVTKKGNTSVYDSVLNGIRILQQNNIDFVVQATINKNHIEKYEPGYAIEWAKEIEKINWINMAVIPVETDIPELKISGTENIKKLDLFTRELTNYYINKLFDEEVGLMATGIIAPLIQIAKNRHVRSCRSGYSVLCDTDESVYPCQMFCNLDEFNIGNLDNEWDFDKIIKFANVSRLEGEKCSACIARQICSVWCKGLQFLSNGDMHDVCEPRCTFQIANMEECIKTLAMLKKGTDTYDRFWNNYKKTTERLGDLAHVKSR